MPLVRSGDLFSLTYPFRLDIVFEYDSDELPYFYSVVS